MLRAERTPLSLTTAEAAFVTKSIRCLLEEHRDRPFFILREAGVVAELRGKLLRESSPFRPAADPGFKEKRKRPIFDHDGIANKDVSRVQMEMTVKTKMPDAKTPWQKTLDIAILSANPELLIYGNGPGDVVEQVPPLSVAAAFEVKASPSGDEAARGSYLKDILVLLWLRHHHKIPGYFVLLDKSQPLYGAYRKSKVQRLPAWNLDSSQKITIRSKSMGNQTGNGLGAWGLQVHDEPVSKDSVEVWMIGSGAGPVRAKYVTFSDDRAPDMTSSLRQWLMPTRPIELREAPSRGSVAPE